MDGNIDNIIGTAVDVYWEGEDEWFPGMIDDHHPERGFHIQYYDGDEEWLETLQDRKIKFEKGREGAGTDPTAVQDPHDSGAFEPENNDEQHDYNRNPSNISFNDTELEIVYEPADVTQPDVLQEEDDDNDFRIANGIGGIGGDAGDGFIDFDYHDHQENNKAVMCANLQLLPPRGVMLVGSVLGAEELFSSDPNVRPEGELLFKVLFVEGGNQPAMFRCKTPVFTSDPVVASSRPIWDKAQFQLDMVMPEVEGVQPQTYSLREYGFNIQGEVLVAVYQSRSTGGNNMLGQVSFDLADVVKNGTAEFFLPGYEGRSIAGAQSLTSRTGDFSGELEVQLNIGWKALFNMRRSGGAEGRDGSRACLRQELATAVPRSMSAGTMGESSRQPGPATPSAAGSTAAKSRTRSGSGAAATGSVKSRKPKPGVGAQPTGPPRKIASRYQIRQAAESKRIAAENKKLQAHLSGYATAKNKAPGVGTLAGLMTAAAESKTKSRDSHSMGTGAVLNYGSWEKHTDGAAADLRASTRQLQAMDDVQELFELLQQLRKDNATAEAENQKLRAKLGNLKTNIRQCEMGIARRKPSTSAGAAAQAKGGQNGDIAETVAYKSSAMAAVMAKSSGIGGGGAVGTELRVLVAEPKAAASSTTQGGGAKGTDTKSVSPGLDIGPLSEAQLDALGISDGEYRSLAEEHRVLQSVRRGLLERIAAAKQACAQAAGQQASAGQRMTLLRRRLSYYEDIAGDIVRLPQQQQAQPKRGRGGSGGGGGGHKSTTTGGGTAKQLAWEQNVTNDQEGGGRDSLAALGIPDAEQDFLVFDRLRAAKTDLAREQLVADTGMATAAQDSGLEELRAVAAYLRDKCAAIEGGADGGRQEALLQRQRLAAIVEGDVLHRRREFVSKMRVLALRERQAQLLVPLREGQQAIELELLRLRLRKREKNFRKEADSPAPISVTSASTPATATPAVSTPAAGPSQSASAEQL